MPFRNIEKLFADGRLVTHQHRSIRPHHVKLEHPLSAAECPWPNALPIASVDG